MLVSMTNHGATAEQAEVLVTGATGFIGRWLLAALTRRGQVVAALVRDAARRGPELRAFVERLGGDGACLVVVEGDVEVAGLGLERPLPNVRVVHHLAARFAFGLTREAARRTNVDGTRHVMAWASGLSGLERFVFLGGYRVTAFEPARLASAEGLREAYRAGAYEGSKHEAYAVFRALASDLALPWTAVHPSGLIGDSRTGETMQTVGLGDTMKELFLGRLPAQVGSPRVFVPVVTVDYLADYLASVPLRAESAGKDLVVFDPASPALPELLAIGAEHLGVPLPKRTLPLGLVRALPRRLTGVEPESLSFLSEDRYDTREGDAHAAEMGLVHPPLVRSVQRWCDFLVRTRFLALTPESAVRPSEAGDRGRLVRGVYTAGEPTRADVVLLHGLPFDGEAMQPLARRLGRSHARLDLPGLGRSLPVRAPNEGWLAKALGERAKPAVLIGHSLGAGVAVEHAARHPEQVAALVLIAPAFLAEAAPWTLRVPAAVSIVLGGLTRTSFQERLLAEGDEASLEEAKEAVESACASLARRGGARRAAEALADASRQDRRASLRASLREVIARGVPVLIVHAAVEPIVFEVPGARVVCLEGAGHNLHLTHVEAVADAVRAFLDARPPRAAKPGSRRSDDARCEH